MCPECPKKDWRDKSCWLSPRQSESEVVQGPDGVTCISDLAWSRLGVEPAELSEIAVDRGVFRVLLGLLPPRPSPEEKGAWE